MVIPGNPLPPMMTSPLHHHLLPSSSLPAALCPSPPSFSPHHPAVYTPMPRTLSALLLGYCICDLSDKPEGNHGDCPSLSSTASAHAHFLRRAPSTKMAAPVGPIRFWKPGKKTAGEVRGRGERGARSGVRGAQGFLSGGGELSWNLRYCQPGSTGRYGTLLRNSPQGLRGSLSQILRPAPTSAAHYKRT